MFNPTGSAKDRAAKYMVDDAENRGVISKGATIIEPTSGNTGIGLAAYAVPKGYRVIIVMPDTMSEERRLLMKAYGAELVLTDGKLGMSGSIAEAERLHKEIAGSFIPDQFGNPANALSHYETTGPEIWNDTDGKIDIFVAGVGTGGTITGVGRFLKEKNPDIKIVAVEPENSAVLSGGKAGAHGLQGIGAGFIPKVLDVSILDEIITVSDEDAYSAGRLLGKSEGILSGISSGAALHAGITLAKREENKGKNIIVLLPDTGSRYLSTKMFSEA
jgi:cysteine synthase A